MGNRERDTLEVVQTATTVTPIDFQAAEAVALRLKAEFGQLIETFPRSARKASGMARWLNLQVPLCHRVLTAARKPTQTAETLTTIPGSAGLEIFIDAARRCGAPLERLDAAGAAAAEFENLIQRFGGSQRKLIDALGAAENAGGGAAGEAGAGSHGRRLSELRAANYRLACELSGASADATVSLRVHTPSPDEPGQLDVHGVVGRTGFERQNAALPIVLAHGVPIQQAEGTQPPRGDQRLLDDFCSKPLPRLTTVMRDNSIVEIVDPNFEMRGPMDFLAGPFTGKSVSMTVDGRRYLNSISMCGAPSRSLLTDVYLPAAVAAKMTCAAASYRHGIFGGISGDPSKRWFDRLPGSLMPGLLGRGLDNAQSECYGRQGELTARLFSHLGIDAGQYVGYRLEVAYPLANVYYVLSFESVGGEERLG